MQNTLIANRISYTRNNRPIFKDVSFKLSTGEALYVKGSNGSGKTSLLKVILGLSPPSTGEILWNGKKIHEIGNDYTSQITFTGHRLAIKNELTLMQNIAFSLENMGISLDVGVIEEALIAFELESLKNAPTYQLSEGQKRRLSLLRLWCSPSPLWILDEPLNNLDDHSVEILERLLERHLENGLVIFTSHQTPQRKFNKLFEINLSE